MCRGGGERVAMLDTFLLLLRAERDECANLIVLFFSPPPSTNIRKIYISFKSYTGISNRAT